MALGCGCAAHRAGRGSGRPLDHRTVRAQRDPRRRPVRDHRRPTGLESRRPDTDREFRYRRDLHARRRRRTDDRRSRCSHRCRSGHGERAARRPRRRGTGTGDHRAGTKLRQRDGVVARAERAIRGSVDPGPPRRPQRIGRGRDRERRTVVGDGRRFGHGEHLSRHGDRQREGTSSRPRFHVRREDPECRQAVGPVPITGTGPGAAGGEHSRQRFGCAALDHSRRCCRRSRRRAVAYAHSPSSASHWS